MIEHNLAQGSPEWLEARRGVVTGSRFKDCRDKLKDGRPSKACLDYALDVARERCGGRAPEKFQNAAMRTGTEQESPARRAYERQSRNLVEEVGFFTTDDRLFGLSPDGFIDGDGVLEIKTMVSSATLFTAVADGDVSAYMDQCLGYLWLLGRQWVDLVLWAPDLGHMTVKRIERNEDQIEALEADLMAFAKLVQGFEDKLRAAVGKSVAVAATPAAAAAPTQPPAAAPVASPAVSSQARTVVPMQRPTPAPASKPTLTLGQIGQRLGFPLTAAFLASLGFEPAAKEGAALKFHEASWQAICAALVAHIEQAAAQRQAA